MKNSLRSILTLSVVASITGFTWPCLAQLQPVKLKGVVAGVSPLGVVIRNDKGQIMLALTSPDRTEDGVRYRGIPEPVIEVISQEKPDYLQTGMWVRFPARVQAKRRVVEPVQEVTVISGSKITAFGVLPSELPDLPAENAEAPAAKATDIVDSLVVGRIISARPNTITVVFPDGKSLQAGLAKDVVIQVKGANLQFIKVGYLVEAAGMMVKPNKFFATSLKISKPVVEPKGPKPAPAQVAGKGKEAVPGPGPAKPADSEKPNPFKIGKPDSPAKTADKPAKLRGRILEVN
ncbi:MAG: hypothetical protein VB877_12950 [Pirellulaceae bacterium]